MAGAFAGFDGPTRTKLGVAEFSVVQASLEKVFIRIVSGEGGKHAAARASLGRRVASDLERDEDSEDDLDDFEFVERTCCCTSYFAYGLLAKWHTCCCCALSCYHILGVVGAPWITFSTVFFTIFFHMCSAIHACIGRCCTQAPKAED